MAAALRRLLASHWRLLLLFLLPALGVAAFAFAVDANDRARQLYERRLRDPLEKAEFAFIWLGSMYFVLPMIAFYVVEDWSKVLYDCFTPMALWVDAMYSGIVITFHIFFIGITPESYSKVLIEYGGFAIQLVAIFVYVMLKSGDKNCIASQVHMKALPLSEARQQSLLLLLVFKIFILAAIMQLQFKLTFPEGHNVIASALCYTAMALQIKGAEGFENDEPRVRKVKITATIIKIVVLSYELWIENMRGGHEHSELKSSLRAMTITSIVVNCMLFIARYIGPRVFRDCIFPSEGQKETRKQYFARTLSTLHTRED
uniref:Uncharacterized protein n=1 Tax=Oryza brachyantha TaxID=4533 RepID=J3N687_ORYBR